MAINPSEYDFLNVEVKDDIAFAIIDHPERRNACLPGDSREFTRFLTEIAEDDQVKVGVLGGIGKAFCTGGGPDVLENFRTNKEALDELSHSATALVEAHIRLEKPVITALNGYATGVGAAFALLSDFIIVDRSVRFGDGHIRGALAAGDGGVLIWPMSIGIIKAKQYLLTGDMIEAEEAARLGLITEVVDDGMCLDRATQIAKRLAAGPQFAIRASKKAVNQWYAQSMATVFALSIELEEESIEQPEFAVAIEKMRNKESSIPSDRWRSAWAE